MPGEKVGISPLEIDVLGSTRAGLCRTTALRVVKSFTHGVTSVTSPEFFLLGVGMGEGGYVKGG